MPRRSGEQCRCHGSIARRVDALSGAVETQKTPGCLQCYCFMFMQRLHQFATLTEIAEKVAEGLVNADELQEKEFLREICCQSSHAQGSWKEQNSVEEQFPCYEATSSCDLPCKDERNDAASGSSAFKAQLGEALQYFICRCQHHIHRRVVDTNTKREKRLVPNTNASKKNRNECKHEAPQTDSVSTGWTETLVLVCEGIARQCGLRTSGHRNRLGHTLGLRIDA